jgi:hypothetical protein
MLAMQAQPLISSRVFEAGEQALVLMQAVSVAS